MFFDITIFALVFFSIFFVSLSQRSIIYNITISLLLLVKSLIGVFFYKRHSLRALRVYLVMRYLYNIVIVFPAIIIFRYLSATFTVSYFVAAVITMTGEIFITIVYGRYIIINTPYETIEMIRGCKITKLDKDHKHLVVSVITKLASLDLKKSFSINEIQTKK
jgi:hypothetical protein